MENGATSGSFVKTVISTNDYNFNWTIENFRNLANYDEVTSPVFYFSPNHVLCAKATKKPTCSCFSFEIILIKGSPIEITRNLYVADGAGEVLYKSSQCCEYSLESDSQCLFSFDSSDIENNRVDLVNIMNYSEYYAL